MGRIIAERIRTGEILSWDAPISDAVSTFELSGPGGITGFIDPVDRDLLGDDGQPIFEEWATALHHEHGDTIRSGIVQRIAEDEDGRLLLEAPGFSSYPHGIRYAHNYRPAVGTDALDHYRHFWTYVQDWPDAELGVTVDPLLSGENADDPPREPGEPIEPYHVPWWEYRDVGREQDRMLEIASADYIEVHGWNEDHTGFTHHIRLGVPRLGKKRDLRFVEGENVISALTYEVDGDRFAQNVYAVGKGEGRAMAAAYVPSRDHRLRRTALVSDKTAGPGELNSLARRELHRRSATGGFDEVLIRDHQNARLSDIEPGDDIHVEATLRWYGRTRLWVRVLSIEFAANGEDVALLRTARSEWFRDT